MSYAKVVSTLALIVALGGTSYAAIKLPRNSVGSREIVTGGVRSAEIRDGSVRRIDLAADAVSSSSTVQAYVVRPSPASGGCDASAPSDCSGALESNASASCSAGWIAVGGSVAAPEGYEDMRIVIDEPTVDDQTGTPNGWKGTIHYTGNGTTVATPTVTAICIKVG